MWIMPGIVDALPNTCIDCLECVVTLFTLFMALDYFHYNCVHVMLWPAVLARTFLVLTNIGILFLCECWSWVIHQAILAKNWTRMFHSSHSYKFVGKHCFEFVNIGLLILYWSLAASPITVIKCWMSRYTATSPPGRQISNSTCRTYWSMWPVLFPYTCSCLRTYEYPKWWVSSYIVPGAHDRRSV